MTSAIQEDISSYDEGARAKSNPEEVAGLNRAVTSEPIASSSSGASVDRLFVSAGVCTNTEEDQEQFQVCSECWHQIELRKFR